MPRKTASGKWQARVVDPITRKRLALGTFNTEKEAKVAEVTEYARIKSGEIVGGGRISFETFALQYLETRKIDLAPDSYRNSLYNLNNWLLPTFGKRELRKITPAAVRAWFLTLPETPGRKAIYSLMSQIMKQALYDGEINRNPVLIRGAMKDTSTPREYVPPADIHMLRTMAGDSSQMGVLLFLVMGGALRIGEALALNWEDVDLTNGTVHVYKHLVPNHGMQKGTKHDPEGDRTIAVPEAVTAALKGLKNTRTTEHDTPVFINTKGTRYSYNSFHREFNKLKASIGLDHVHVHDLRHTGLTLYAQTGATQGEIMSRGGHRDHRSSMRYQHSNLERDKANTERMNMS